MGLSEWVLAPEGERLSEAFRLRYLDAASGESVSPWHDVPLFNSDGTVNMVVEIPRYTRAKMEIATDEPGNPIKQDIKKGKLREYGWGDMCFNYGALPQTWEDPDEADARTGINGDDDPVDVIDVGLVAQPFGSVVRVKVLGALAMIDDGETDWKVVAISASDPMSDAVSSLADLDVVQPSVLDSFREWMRLYKTVDGKPVNSFAFEGQYLDAEAARSIIGETHQAWKRLVDSGKAV